MGSYPSGFALALPPDSKAIRKIEAPYAQNPGCLTVLLRAVNGIYFILWRK